MATAVKYGDDVAARAACTTFRRILVSSGIAGEKNADGISLAEGEVYGFAPGMAVPPELAAFSEPVPVNWAPLRDVVAFNPERWAKALRGRPDPAPLAMLELADLFARFNWTQAELDAAIASLGFPPPTGYRQRRESEPKRPIWRADQVDAWEATSRRAMARR